MKHKGITFFSLILFSVLSAGQVISQSSNPLPTPSILPKPQEDNSQTIDIAEWVHPYSTWGTTKFRHGELFMSSKWKSYYYVLVAPEEYSTEGAVTQVKLRNVKSGASYLGYGLIFHSNPEPLKQDYAFLIDTMKKRYRVVRHEPGKEISVIKWTKSIHIKGGKRQNILEVRDKGDKTELFINGQLVSSIENTYAFKSGSAGLYSGDRVKIAFKDLKIRK